jgi:hypothetical protein
MISGRRPHPQHTAVENGALAAAGSDIYRLLIDSAHEPRPPDDPSLQGEIHGETKHPLRFLLEIHDIPFDRFVELDRDIGVALRTLLVSGIRAENPDLADAIPLAKAGFRFPEPIDRTARCAGISSGLCGMSWPP